MKTRCLIALLLLVACIPSFAQPGDGDLDVTKLTADTKTFIFSDDKHTVKQYIYDQLAAKTSCCGNDRIYLEVKIDPTGYVLQAKTLTGKNECVKLSAIDIVKNIKWDTKDFKGARSVYFEIKPEMACDGSESNEYAQVPTFNNGVLDENGVPLTYASSTKVPAIVAAGIVDKVESAPIAANDAKPAATTKPEEKEEPMAMNTNRGNEEKETPKAQPDQEKPEKVANNESDEEAQRAKDEARRLLEQQKREELEAKKQAEEMKKQEEMAESQRMKEEEEARKRREEEARRREEIAKRQEDERARAEQERKEQVAESAAEKQARLKREKEEQERERMAQMTPQEREQERLKQEQNRLKDELAQLEAEKRAEENKIRDIESQTARASSDIERTEGNIVRIDEKIFDLKEKVEQKREEEELARIESEKRRAEEKAREKEQALNNLMRDLERMKRDAERLEQDFQREQEKLAETEAEKQKKEEEIAYQRQIREQEREAAMAATQNGGSSTQPAGNMSALNMDFSGQVPDSLSDESKMLLAQMQAMQAMIQQLSQKIESQGGGVSNPYPPQNMNVSNTNQGTRTVQQTPQQPQSNYSGSGDPVDALRATIPYQSKGELESQADDEHQNLAVGGQPKFSMPNYDGGDKGLKAFVRTELRNSGVCGIAQGFAEVTINNEGKVVDYNIMKTNTAEVQSALPAILSKLTFDPSSVRVVKYAYIEFKSEIVCDEDKDPTDLNTVKDYIIKE